MKRVLYLLIFLMLASACNEKVIEKPEDLIAREKMIDILYDLALINAGKAIDPLALEKNQLEPMAYIYEKYQIDSSQFVRSDLYYAAIPEEYEAIYKSLEERLEAERLRIEEERQQVSDSTRKSATKKAVPDLSKE